MRNDLKHRHAEREAEAGVIEQEEVRRVRRRARRGEVVVCEGKGVIAGDKVRAGMPLANITDPYEGHVLETLYSPVNGIVFFIHNEPLTYANTAVIKILGDE